MAAKRIPIRYIETPIARVPIIVLDSATGTYYRLKESKDDQPSPCDICRAMENERVSRRPKTDRKYEQRL